MLRAILNNSSGDAALSRFFTGNTWTAQQIFVSPTTTSPGAVFQANGTISAIPASEANVTAMFQGTEAVQSYTMFSSSAQQINVLFRRRQGTYASPTAVQTNNVLGAIQWQGYGVSTFGSSAAAEIRGVARQNFTESARGTNIEFYATSNGATSLTLMSTFRSDFAAFTVDVAATGFNLNKTAGQSRPIQFQSSSINRWALIANATAEGGSNAGSDFEIRRYSDAGADLGVVFGMTRSTGVSFFNGDVNFSSRIALDFGNATNKVIRFRTSSLDRWQLICNNATESTGNAGSNFEIRRYSDAQADLGAAVSIVRSTGVTTLGADRFNLSTAITGITASGSAGNAGDIAWDDTYLYVRMSTGWRRIALGAAF